MPDILERLHTVVQEGVGTPPPVETLARRARRSARLRRVPLLALVAVSLVAVVVFASLSGAQHGPRLLAPAVPGTRSLRYTVASATPPGWTAVAWGDAQVSVPDDWSVTLEEQPCGYGTRALAIDPRICKTLASQPPSALVEPLPARYPRTRPAVVNGIEVFRAVERAGRWTFVEEYAPSLGVELGVVALPGGGKTSTGARILDSLTHSPRVIALEAGPAPRVPRDWRRVTFGGLALEVPPQDGAPQATPVYPTPTRECTPVQSLADSVVLDTDRHFGVYHCPAYDRPYAKAIFPGGSGVEVDAKPQALGTWVSGLSRTCETVNRLRVCPYRNPATDILALQVSGAGLPHPLLVEIGLDGSGMTARTVLYSLRPA